MEKQCPNCGATLEDEAMFCVACGAAIRRCPGCGAALDSDANFCGECGRKISSVPSTTTSTTNKISYKKWIPLGALVAVAAIGGFAFMAGNKGSNNPPPAAETVSISVKANDMIDDYVRDQTGAEQQYKNKKIKLTGQLVSKSQFNNSQDYALVIGNKFMAGKSYSVLVDLPPDKAAEANKVNFGDFVSVEGQCVGIVKQDNPTEISIQVKTNRIN